MIFVENYFLEYRKVILRKQCVNKLFELGVFLEFQ